MTDTEVAVGQPVNGLPSRAISEDVAVNERDEDARSKEEEDVPI